MADKIASGAYTVVSTGASAVSTGVSYGVAGAGYMIDKADDGVMYASEKWQGPKKLKPAPLKDNYQ